MTQQGIKAIETVYNGYRFRSRLEARWAVFFDALGIKYEYEKEGFDLGAAGRYLPDFWLPDVGYWVEIKPANFLPIQLQPERQFRALACQSQHPVLLLAGDPWPDAYVAVEWGWRFRDDPNDPQIIDIEALATCRRCGAFALDYGSGMGFAAFDCRNEPERECRFDKGVLRDSVNIMEAYRAARQARFEHGESPSTTAQAEVDQLRRQLSTALDVSIGAMSDLVDIVFGPQPRPQMRIVPLADTGFDLEAMRPEQREAHQHDVDLARIGQLREYVIRPGLTEKDEREARYHLRALEVREEMRELDKLQRQAELAHDDTAVRALLAQKQSLLAERRRIDLEWCPPSNHKPRKPGGF